MRMGLDLGSLVQPCPWVDQNVINVFFSVTAISRPYLVASTSRDLITTYRELFSFSRSSKE